VFSIKSLLSYAIQIEEQTEWINTRVRQWLDNLLKNGHKYWSLLLQLAHENI
jgi:hypothetical protein